MSISEIRERARVLRDAGNAHIDILVAWDALVTLCTDASQAMGSRARISIPTNKQFKNWTTIRFYADGIVTACDLIEPPPQADVPGESHKG